MDPWPRPGACPSRQPQGAQGACALPLVRGRVLSPPPPGPRGEEVTFKPVVLCGTQTFQAPGKCIGKSSFDRRLHTQVCVGPRHHVGLAWRPMGKRLPAARLRASPLKPRRPVPQMPALRGF